MAANHLILFSLFLVCFATEVTSQRRRCSLTEWPERLSSMNMSNPVSDNNGKVVLVALMKGYCGYCVQQAQSLEAMQRALAVQGFTDIEIVLVNGGENISRINIQNLVDAASFPVLQDTEDHILFRDIFNGSKDDFVVFDRCGQRAYLIPHPYSYMANSITERILMATYMGRQPCYCRMDRPARREFIRNRRLSRRGGQHGGGRGGRRGGRPDGARVEAVQGMQGDQPRGGAQVQYQQVQTGGGHGVGIRCRQGDTWCQRYVTEFMQGTLGSGSSGRRANRNNARRIGILHRVASSRARGRGGRRGGRRGRFGGHGRHHAGGGGHGGASHQGHHHGGPGSRGHRRGRHHRRGGHEHHNDHGHGNQHGGHRDHQHGSDLHVQQGEHGRYPQYQSRTHSRRVGGAV